MHAQPKLIEGLSYRSKHPAFLLSISLNSFSTTIRASFVDIFSVRWFLTTESESESILKQNRGQLEKPGMSLLKAPSLCIFLIFLSVAGAFSIQGIPGQATLKLEQCLRRRPKPPQQALLRPENRNPRSKGMLGSVGGMGGAVPSKGGMSTKEKMELLVYIFLWYATSVSKCMEMISRISSLHFLTQLVLGWWCFFEEMCDAGLQKNICNFETNWELVCRWCAQTQRSNWGCTGNPFSVLMSLF